MKRSFLMVMVLAAILAAPAAAIPVAKQVSLICPCDDVVLGDTFSVDIEIAGLDDIDISTFDFDVLYDSAVISFTGYELGDELGDVDLFEAFDFSEGELIVGEIDLAEVSDLTDLSGQADVIIAATLTFTADEEGTTGITIADDADFYLGDYVGDPVDAQINNCAVTIVPEPATIALSIAGLAFFRRKRS